VRHLMPSGRHLKASLDDRARERSRLRFRPVEANGGEGDGGAIPEGPAYLIFSGPISQENARELASSLSVCANERREEVHLLLNTFGGNLNAGIFLYNFMKGLPFKLVTHNTGTVASIGVAVYLAGDERLACSKSSFFTHGVTHTPPPGEGLTAKRLSELHDNVKADQEQINKIMGERTGLDEEELNKRSEVDKTTDPSTAVEEGIAHGVAEIDIPADAGYVYTVEAKEPLT
jgi:ATP-dependent Clp protease protease subunit